MDGLRTLVFAQKVLTDDQAKDFLEKLLNAVETIIKGKSDFKSY